MYFYEEYYNSYAHLMWSLFSIDNNPTYIEQQLFFSQIKCLICRQESKLRKMKTYYEKHSNTWGANSTMSRNFFSNFLCSYDFVVSYFQNYRYFLSMKKVENILCNQSAYKNSNLTSKSL